jgi:hypothetical protein
VRVNWSQSTVATVVGYFDLVAGVRSLARSGALCQHYPVKIAKKKRPRDANQRAYSILQDVIRLRGEKPAKPIKARKRRSVR